EDGIRDWSVTGVQTCALPIYENYGSSHEPIILADYTGPNGLKGRASRLYYDPVTSARSSLCVADAGTQPRICLCVGAGAGAGDWSQHRHLHGGELGPAAAAAPGETGATGSAAGTQPQSRVSGVLDLAGQLPGLPGQQPQLL